MGGHEATLSGPDFSKGLPLADVSEGSMLLGHSNGKPVLLAKVHGQIFAIGANCTHYGAPLSEGFFTGASVRCPWHHACFNFRTGEAARAPALNHVTRWAVDVRGDSFSVTRELESLDGATPASDAETPAATDLSQPMKSQGPEAIVIVGGGAAGNACAERLRRLGYLGKLTMISADESLPYDRPNLSKDYLAGNAPEDWIPLRPADFYQSHNIEILNPATVNRIDTRAHTVALADGRTVSFDRLLLATGADPVRLEFTGSATTRVFYLRTLADARAIIAATANAKTAVVIGASFIGLEVAASLRARGIEVHVVAPEEQPLVRVMGPEIGAFIRTLHEDKGVVFHLGNTVQVVDADSVQLKSGERIKADLVIAGVGVRPSVGLAESAGLAIDKGVLVNEFLETNAPGIFAAGDIARWPDPHSGTNIRVEHWVVAERQGQTAARNMLADASTDEREEFNAVPFFWSAHYDTTIRYVGHAQSWDSIEIDGDLSAGDARVTFIQAGRATAVATVGRDLENLRAEVALEQHATANYTVVGD